MKPLSACQLYTFVDTAYLHGRDPRTIAQQLCDGGSDLIQLRAKGHSPDQVRRLAEQVFPVIDGAGVGLVINDYPGVAAVVSAPLCHLGQEDFFEAGHRHVNELLLELADTQATPLEVGLSTHAPSQAERAQAAGASYVAIGPVYATGTKPTAAPVTLEYVRWAATHLALPWFAIGGITLANLDAVLEAGARRVCVVSAILTAPDVVQACQKFKDRLRLTAP